MRRFTLTLALASIFLVPATGSAQRCELPTVMLTVDRSSSMLGELPGGLTKWSAATMAIGEISSAYEGRIDFGLQVFPYPDRCEPGRVVLEPGPHAGADVVEALGAPPPSSGNFTPMSQTLEAVLGSAALTDTARTRHLVLVTDGWQWCSPYDPATRFTPVAAITALRERGIVVHVVGFGAAVDSLTLNRAAVAAGTALPGCDATLSDPAAMNHCYVQANDLGDLRAALGDVARLVTDELCDAIDNDCDGLVDEGWDRDEDGYTRCGTRDGVVVPELADCADDDGAIHPEATEICNGVDDDCDGVTDPGCACLDGDEMPCGSDVGACAAGTQRCEDGAWGVCVGATEPSEETCDGVDEDCDGAIDEAADASCGAGMACTADGCVPVLPEPEEPMMPPVDEEVPMRRGRQDGGCACSAAGSARDAHSGLALFSMLGLGIVALYRRRR